MFQLEPLEFAFIAPNMSHQDATTVCQRLVTAAESFAPIGNEPLRRVPMMEPTRGTQAHVEELFSSCETPGDLLAALEGK